MKKFWIVASALMLGAVVLVWGAGRSWFVGERDQASIVEPNDKEDDSVSKPISRKEAKAELAELLGVEQDEFVDIGENFSRPKRDLAFDPDNSNAKRPRGSVFPNPGRAPFLKGDENSQVAGLMAELTNQDEEKRVQLRIAKSTFFAPEPFNRKKYRGNETLDANLNYLVGLHQKAGDRTRLAHVGILLGASNDGTPYAISRTGGGSSSRIESIDGGKWGSYQGEVKFYKVSN